ncbi:unnamed protein product [Closterium sp. NIES-64]|nr:unnamed protein product [Closterium sp. NIES-64]
MWVNDSRYEAQMSPLGRARDKQCASKGRSTRGAKGGNNGGDGEVAEVSTIARCLRSGRRQSTNGNTALKEGIESDSGDLLAQQYQTRLETETELPEPHDLVYRLRIAKQPEKMDQMTLFNADGVGCVVEASDIITIANGQCVTDAIMDFHNVLLSIRQPTTPNDTSWAAVDSKAFIYVNTFGKPYSMGNASRVFDKHKVQQQDNQYDCGIFVCHFIKVLVDTDFKTLRSYLYLEGISATEFRRGMRGDLCMHAASDLILALVKLGVVVPKQPAARVTKHGAVVDSGVKDHNTKLTRMQVEHYGMKRDLAIWKAAVTAVGVAMGYSVDQLLAGAAHVL